MELVLAQSREPFAAALDGLVAQHGWTYRQLAYLTGLSAGYLAHLRRGDRPAPRDEMIERIAARLRVSPSYFLEYRVRQVARLLSAQPEMLDYVYERLAHEQEARTREAAQLALAV
jgi:transcriptional regulator with XRE-family HTH domain